MCLNRTSNNNDVNDDNNITMITNNNETDVEKDYSRSVPTETRNRVKKSTRTKYFPVKVK